MKNDRHKNRGGHNFINLAGQRFGKLVVVSDTGRRKSKRPVWLCRCDCGNDVEVLGKYLKIGDTKSCGCFVKGNAHNRDAVGEICMSAWTPIFRSAKRRGIPFEITREQAWAQFLAQGRRCVFTGMELTFSTNFRDQRHLHTASLDRIDSSKGYVLGNIQWVHKRVNIMKNVMCNTEFLEWCRRIVDWASSDKGHHEDPGLPSKSVV